MTETKQIIQDANTPERSICACGVTINKGQKYCCMCRPETTPEKSVEEIVEDFESKFFAKAKGQDDNLELYSLFAGTKTAGDIKKWFTQTLQAERQKREEAHEKGFHLGFKDGIQQEQEKRDEMVEAEKYRILRLVRDFQLNYTSGNLIREWKLLNKVKLIIGKSDMTRLNNPN